MMGAKSQRDVAAVYPAPSLILGWGGGWKSRKCGCEKNRVFNASLERTKGKSRVRFLTFAEIFKTPKNIIFRTKNGGCKKTRILGVRKKQLFLEGTYFLTVLGSSLKK